MKTHKCTPKRRRTRRPFEEPRIALPCPRWLQRKMRANLTRAARCPVSPHRAARAAAILAQAQREPESLVPSEAVAPQSAPSPQPASPALVRVPRAAQHAVVRSPRWSPSHLIKAATGLAQRVLQPRAVGDNRESAGTTDLAVGR